MTSSFEPDARLILQLIAEGYKAEGLDDRYVRIENPDYEPDNGTDPYLVFDTFTLYPVPTEEEMEDVA